MKSLKTKSGSIRLGIWLVILTGGLSGCSPSEMLSARPAQNSSQRFITAKTTTTLLSGEQMVRSMSAVTQLAPNGTIIQEYQNRKALMTDNYMVNSVTSPMMVSVTNLASRFCEALVTKEAALNSSERRFFNEVDFSKGVNALNQDQYNAILNRMSKNILGRAPSGEEVEILNSARSEFEAAISVGNKTQSSQTRLLLLFSCSGILSSFDFITI